MRFTPLMISLVLIGFAGGAQAAKPVKHVKKVAPAAASTHKVKKGETAAKIAQASDLSLEELAALNPRVNLHKLSIGTVLRVKGRAAKPAAPVVAAKPEPAAPAEAVVLAVPVVPAAPIPVIPSSGPAVLVHMERLIPSGAAPRGPVSWRSSARTSSPLPAEDLVPVFPPASGLEYESLVADNLGFTPADPSHLDLLWPVETRSISSPFGPRMRTATVRVVKANRKKLVRKRFQGSHKGVDLTAPIGSDVYAVQDGRVAFSGVEKGYGNLVIVDHGNGVETRYAHLKVRFAQVGDTVQRGQKIAEVGMTGHTTGPHLHLEVRLNGVARDPMPVLNETEEIPAEMMALNQALPSSQR